MTFPHHVATQGSAPVGPGCTSTGDGASLPPEVTESDLPPDA